jgi:hypothetical protein
VIKEIIFNDWEATLFIDPIPRLMVYLFAKYGLEVSIEHIITYTINSLMDFVYEYFKDKKQ